MFVSDVLKKKGTDVITTDPEISVADTARTLKGKGIGAIVVMGETGIVAGIISERDIVHGIAMHGNRALEMPVWELMTEEVVTCRRDDTINQAMQRMADHSCRHLPVVEDGELKGLVSMSDVVKLRMEELQSHIAETKMSESDDDTDAWPVKD
jgi:CBS domain-containing protein